MTRQGTFLLRISLWSLVAVAALLLAWAWLRPEPTQQLLFSELGRGDYHLTTADGQSFTEASLQGKPSAVFFGFTHCPDVCPTTLGEIMAWQEDLDAEGDALRTFFITVDPERDTPEVLGEYVSWVPGVTGVTGDPAEVDKAMAAFRAYAQKVPLKGGDYTVNHSAQVLLFDAEGNYFSHIGYQEDHDRAMTTLRRLMAG
ncbi:SCO family protein [Paracoccus indicus]|uniref:SCO family protein n=1 Tax=Paracoccus indicus TaxID=2079229 RepID=UPI000D3D8549|nr:SCO family protein [Paracoccus indicus]